MANFLVFVELSLVDGSVGLLQHSLTLLLAVFKPAFVFGVIFEIFKLSEPVELIVMESALVLCDSFEEVLALSFLHAIEEASLVA